MRYPLIHAKGKISDSQKRGWFQTNQPIYKVSWWHKYQKETACLPSTHTWYGSQDEWSIENRIAPPRIVHLKRICIRVQNAQGGITTFTISRKHSTKTIKHEIQKWHGRKWELTQTWQEIRQIKPKDNVKMINNFHHINDYQLSKTRGIWK